VERKLLQAEVDEFIVSIRRCGDQAHAAVLTL